MGGRINTTDNSNNNNNNNINHINNNNNNSSSSSNNNSNNNSVEKVPNARRWKSIKGRPTPTGGRRPLIGPS